MIKLYELVTKENGYSASPYVILVELLLKHKVITSNTQLLSAPNINAF
jgi:hypothetical protein